MILINARFLGFSGFQSSKLAATVSSSSDRQSSCVLRDSCQSKNSSQGELAHDLNLAKGWPLLRLMRT